MRTAAAASSDQGLGDPGPAALRRPPGAFVRRRHLAGADRPHRLVGDDQAGDLLGAQPGQRAVELPDRVLDVPTVLADLEPLPDADADQLQAVLDPREQLAARG